MDAKPKSTRDGFGEGLLELGKTNPKADSRGIIKLLVFGAKVHLKPTL